MQHARLVLIATLIGTAVGCSPPATENDGGDAGGVDVVQPTDVPGVDVAFDVLQPAPNASCTTPTALVPGTALTGQDSSLGTQTLGGWCYPAATGHTLFYTVNVPAGQTALVTARPAASLDLVLRFVSSCTTSTCERFDDHSDATQPEIGHWSNRGTSAANIVIAVSPYQRSANGLFDVVASIVPSEIGVTCDVAPVVPSGTTLHGENLNLAETGTDTRCLATASGYELFYRVTIPASQHLTVTATPTGTWNPVLRILDSCAASSCLASSDTAAAGAPETLTYANAATTPVDVIVTVSSERESQLGSFDLAIATAP